MDYEYEHWHLLQHLADTNLGLPTARISTFVAEVKQHFLLEERFMHEVAYPGRVYHMLSHEHILKCLRDVVKDNQDRFPHDMREFYATMRDILTSHTEIYDAKLIRFVDGLP